MSIFKRNKRKTEKNKRKCRNMAYINISLNKIYWVMYMYKQKIKNDDKNIIEVINIYEENGKNFEDILTETIKNIKIQKQMVIKYRKSQKGGLL